MRNSLYEQVLEQQGVAYDYLPAVPLSMINKTKSLRNQARLSSPIEEELTTQYAQLYRRKSQAPPYVLWQPSPAAKYVLVDGNQRFDAGEQVGLKEHDAYLVKTQDPLIVDRLTWTWNNLVNGKRLSQEECVEHALTFVKKYGYTVKQAAQEWGLNHSTLQREFTIRERREVLERNNYKPPTPVADEVLYRLAPLTNAGEDVFLEAAKVVCESGLSSPDALEMSMEVQNARTHDNKLAVIEEWKTSERVERRRAETKGGRVKVKSLPRDRFDKALDELLKVLEQFQPPALRAPGKAFHKQREKMEDVIDRLTVLGGLGVREGVG